MTDQQESKPEGLEALKGRRVRNKNTGRVGRIVGHHPDPELAHLYYVELEQPEEGEHFEGGKLTHTGEPAEELEEVPEGPLDPEVPPVAPSVVDDDEEASPALAARTLSGPHPDLLARAKLLATAPPPRAAEPELSPRAQRARERGGRLPPEPPQGPPPDEVRTAGLRARAAAAVALPQVPKPKVPPTRAAAAAELESEPPDVAAAAMLRDRAAKARSKAQAKLKRSIS